MRLYEKVARQITKDITGEWEQYETIEPLEDFLRELEELGHTPVLRLMVAMLSEDHARGYDPRHWHELA